MCVGAQWNSFSKHRRRWRWWRRWWRWRRRWWRKLGGAGETACVIWFSWHFFTLVGKIPMWTSARLAQVVASSLNAAQHIGHNKDSWEVWIEPPGPVMPVGQMCYAVFLAEFAGTAVMDALWFQTPGLAKKRVRASLSDLSSLEDVEGMSVRQLKEILTRNFVNYSGCCEKWELVEKVNRLYKENEENQKSCRFIFPFFLSLE